MITIRRNNTLLISRMFTEVLRIRSGQVLAFMSPTSTQSRNCFFEVLNALGRESQEFLESHDSIICTDSDWSIDFSPIAERMGYVGYGGIIEFRYPTQLKGHHPIMDPQDLVEGLIDSTTGHSFWREYR